MILNSVRRCFPGHIYLTFCSPECVFSNILQTKDLTEKYKASIRNVQYFFETFSRVSIG